MPAATLGGTFLPEFQGYLPDKTADVCPSYLRTSAPSGHTSLGISWHIRSPNLRLVALQCRSAGEKEILADGGLPAHTYKPSMNVKPSHGVHTGFTGRCGVVGGAPVL